MGLYSWCTVGWVCIAGALVGLVCSAGALVGFVCLAKHRERKKTVLTNSTMTPLQNQTCQLDCSVLLGNISSARVLLAVVTEARSSKLGMMATFEL